MTIQIREATDADTPALAQVMTKANPRQPFTPEALAHLFRQADDSEHDLHLGRWLALENGEVAGTAWSCSLPETTTQTVTIWNC